LFPFLKVTLKPSGVIALRSLPQSKMRSAFKYPPLTALIGALAYPLLHQKGSRAEVIQVGRDFKSSAEIIRPFIEAVAIKVVGQSRVYGAILKIHRNYRGKIEGAVTSMPMALLYGNSDYIMEVVYLLKDSIFSSQFTLKDFERAAWGITRVGSRESIVSVEDVKTGKAKVYEDKTAETSYSFEIKGGIKYYGKGFIQSVADWKEEMTNYTQAKKILVFYPIGKVMVEGKLKLAKIDAEVLVL